MQVLKFGKSVEESENEMNNNTNQNVANANNETKGITENISNTNSSSKNQKESETKNNEVTNEANTKTSKEEVKELSFEMPVEGEIAKPYARDNLVYSNTLEEWTTHLGIDIKADKTTVVKASEAGTIKSIKNDPRYGLTIVIEHNEEYQTVYSNLLSSEFVVEGEKVEKGQSIGTVGNTASFEIADEPHLHFEILKNSIEEDPSIYLK